MCVLYFRNVFKNSVIINNVSTVQLVLKIYLKCKIHDFEVIFYSLFRSCGLERTLSEIIHLVLLFMRLKKVGLLRYLRPVSNLCADGTL